LSSVQEVTAPAPVSRLLQERSVHGSAFVGALDQVYGTEELFDVL
jgi:hypothetical protein